MRAFAVMPSDSGSDGTPAAFAEAFLDYVNTTFPDTASRWLGYASESDFVNIISQDTFSRDPTDDLPAFAAGIVFTSGTPNWEYTVSFPATRITWPLLVVHTLGVATFATAML